MNTTAITMRRLRLINFIIISLCIFIFSCSRQDTQSSSIQESTASYVANVKAGDFAPGQLQAHYSKHGYQFGAITQNQYLQGARNLLNAPVGKDILEKIRPNGDILRYRLSTGEFAVMTRVGRIRTYFKTDYQYWMRQ